jgi:hypothetical protein
MTRVLARIGAVFFGLWGLLHLVGGSAILAATLGSGPDAGFAFYQMADGPFPPLAGAILAMNSFTIAWVGALVTVIALTRNWRNECSGFALNLTLAGLMDVALVVFLLAPGYVTIGNALNGISLLVIAATCSGIALYRKQKESAAA